MNERIYILGEEYRQVVSHPFVYVSADGRLVTLLRRGKTPANFQDREPRAVVPAVDKDGYLWIWKPKKLVHAIVLTAWVGPRPGPNFITRHLNGNRTDNRLCNLAWGTQRENEDDRIRHGTSKGAGNPASKMDEATVLRLRAEKVNKPYGVLEKENPHLSPFAIWAAVSGYTWAHLPGAISQGRKCSKAGYMSGIRVGKTRA